MTANTGGELMGDIVQEWGGLSQFSLFYYFSRFSELSKHQLIIKYQIHIWQVLLQLGCGDTCQIWMWFDELTCTFAWLKLSLMEKWTNWALVTSTPSKTLCIKKITDVLMLKSFSNTFCWKEIDVFCMKSQLIFLLRPSFHTVVHHTTMLAQCIPL